MIIDGVGTVFYSSVTLLKSVEVDLQGVFLLQHCPSSMSTIKGSQI